MLYGSFYQSPIGQMLILSNGKQLVALYFVGQKNYLQQIKEDINMQSDKICDLVKDWLDEYFLGRCPSIRALPIYLSGTPFLKDLWLELMNIPYGQVLSYGELAKIISLKSKNQKISPRLVGMSLGKNPLMIIVPCHRVVGKNGDLVGYVAGLEKKEFLLKLEGNVS